MATLARTTPAARGVNRFSRLAVGVVQVMIQVSEQGGMGPVAALAVVQLALIAGVVLISRLIPSVKVRE